MRTPSRHRHVHVFLACVCAITAGVGAGCIGDAVEAHEDVASSVGGHDGAHASGGALAAGGAGEQGCEPGAVRSCYDGPAGTAGVGVCQAGEQRCSGDDSSWGACVGARLPSSDDCRSDEDEDCDGASSVCSGSERWSRMQGDAKALDVVHDAAGNAYVTGYHLGNLDFGGRSIHSDGLFDVFVAKLAPDGSQIWLKSFGGESGYEVGHGIALDPAGNVYVAGTFTHAVAFGGGSLSASADHFSDVFVMKLDAQGHHVWSRSGSGPQTQQPLGIAADAVGNVYVVGQCQNAFDFGLSELQCGSSVDAFAVKFDALGAPVWNKRFGAEGGDAIHDVVLTAHGHPIFVGFFQYTVDFGLGPTSGVGSAAPMFVVQYSPAGVAEWQSILGNPSVIWPLGADINGAGELVVGGWIESDADLGTGPIDTVGPDDALVMKLDAMGEPLWVKHFGDEEGQYVNDVAFDDAGNVLLAGRFKGTLGVGSGDLESEGEEIFIAKLDADGEHVWSVAYGNDEAAQAVEAISAGGGVVSTVGHAQFGGLELDNPLSPTAPGGLFILSLEP